MKKFLILLTIVMIAVTNVSAQSSFKGSSSNPTNAISSVSQDTMTFKVSVSALAHGIQITKVTGTTVTGTAYLAVRMGSTEGWINTDTVAIASGAGKTYKLEKMYPVYSEYRWIVVGGGSGSGTLSSSIFAIKSGL